MRRVLAAAAIGLLLFATGCSTAPPGTTPAPEVSSPEASSTGSEVPATAAAAESATPTADPTPTAVGSIKPKNDYCVAYLRIIGFDTETTDEDADFSFESYSAMVAKYDELYTAAAALAPDEVKDEYQTIIQAVEDLKASSDAGDQDSIIAQALQFSETMDTSMDKIMEVSEPICS